MKISIRYGLLISAAGAALKIIMVISKLEAQLSFQRAELGLLAILLVSGLFLSIRRSQEIDYKGGANPTQLLKEGLSTSAVFALCFSIVLIIQKFIENDLPPSFSTLVIGIVFLFILLLISGH
jgi:hypothetical protein